MVGLIIQLISITIPLSLTALFLIKYFKLENSQFLTLTGIFLILGALFNIIMTIIAYIDCEKRDIPSSDKEFWRNVLIKCFYFFCGVPVYYWSVVKKESYKNSSNKQCGLLKANAAYLFFKMEIYLFLFFILLSGVFSIASLVFVDLIDMPIYLFKSAIYVIFPFLLIMYYFYLCVLYEFAQNSRDSEELSFYFSCKKWIFGVLNYYKNRTKSIGIRS